MHTPTNQRSNFIHSGSTWPLFELSGDKTVAPTKVIDDFMQPTVGRALRQARLSHADSSEHTLLEHLAGITDSELSCHHCLPMSLTHLGRRQISQR
jgi:hypothetical protein